MFPEITPCGQPPMRGGGATPDNCIYRVCSQAVSQGGGWRRGQALVLDIWSRARSRHRTLGGNRNREAAERTAPLWPLDTPDGCRRDVELGSVAARGSREELCGRGTGMVGGRTRGRDAPPTLVSDGRPTAACQGPARRALLAFAVSQSSSDEHRASSIEHRASSVQTSDSGEVPHSWYFPDPALHDRGQTPGAAC